jgi:hypothetical protein
MTAPSQPVDETARYSNGRVKYTGQYVDSVMHGAWSWYRTDAPRC